MWKTLALWLPISYGWNCEMNCIVSSIYLRPYPTMATLKGACEGIVATESEMRSLSQWDVIKKTSLGLMVAFYVLSVCLYSG